MFEDVLSAPPDPILGLSDAFRKDANPAKINLSVGVYQDEQGCTPILRCVKEAERRLLSTESSKEYLGIDGSAAYTAQVQQLLFGGETDPARCATAQTPGGTAALRVAADFLHRVFPTAQVWCSRPTWANHPGVFQAAGLAVDFYPYLHKDGRSLDFAGMIQALRQAPAGDVICLHACCHNPTGVDPSLDEWRQIAQVLRERRLLPLVDFAYQGFGDGIEQDAAGLRELARVGLELLVCSSFSKNFGLYGERVGALCSLSANPESAAAVLSQIKAAIRANYSNPPMHGGAIVTTVLNDAELRALWEQEVGAMRERIHRMRLLFVDTLKKLGVKQDFSFLKTQRGMFSYSGLSPLQVDELRTRHAVYIVGSGRINVAGMTEANIPPLCRAIADVLGR
jgi:aspartate/tyrosine/aromatic aminotransferase